MAETTPKSLRDRVASEARHRCGYCLTDQRVSGAQMHIEHIIPRARRPVEGVEPMVVLRMV